MPVENELCVAAIQMHFTDDLTTNVERAIDFIRKARSHKAQVILLPELFEGHYFCKEEQEVNFNRAKPADNHPTILTFQKLAKELQIVMPVSFFERDGQCYYNSMAMVDADGSVMGIYRKSHIPDGPGYEEKFYFRPGNTGFKVWPTRYGKIGVGICWDQWFPECARDMVLQGAEILLYPTAIGSEPTLPNLDTKDPWQRAMIGHAVSNTVPVVAANRIGLEGNQTFYGHSFICNSQGEKVAELSSTKEGVITFSFDLAELQRKRASFGFFRDRRPELYSRISDSQVSHY